MTDTSLKSLFRAMIFQPRIAAEGVIALNHSTQVLWMALTLMSVSLSALVSGMFHLITIPNEAAAEVIRSMLFYSSPLAFALINWGNAVLTIFVLYWSGLMFGGSGRLQDVLAVTVLFQATAVVILVVLAVFGTLLPQLAALAFLAFGIWAVWAMVTIIAVAHRFSNILKAMAVFLMATIIVPLGLSVILGALLAPFIGAQ